VAGLVGWAAVLSGVAIPEAARGATIRFGAAAYTVPVGEPVTLGSLLELAPGEDPLFSYGVTLLYEGPSPEAVEFLAARVPEELAFNGVAGAGANTVTGPGFAGAKGTVDPGNDPLTGFGGPGFVEFDLRFLALGEYDMRLDFFNTLGPTEDIFVTIDGAVIDGDVGFGSARVTVVPEPSVAALSAVALLALIAGGRRRHHRRG
jgi:hypothetical protein